MDHWVQLNVLAWKSPAGKEIKWEGQKNGKQLPMQNNYQNHEGKKKNFDGQSSIQIDPQWNNG